MSEVYHFQQPQPTKRCIYCHEEKPLDAFTRRSAALDGYRTACKKCRKENSQKPKVIVQMSLFTKFCDLCQTEKPIDEFGIQTNNTTGRAKYCKKCTLDQRKKTAKTIVVTTKFCRGCSTEKSIGEFYADTFQKDGHTSQCKACINPARKVNEKRRHKDNPEKRRAIYHRHHDKHKDARNKQAREWHKSHPEYGVNAVGKRRARKYAATYEKISYKYILKRDGMWCYICEKPILDGHKIHFDHVIPLARGGNHTMVNIKVTHSTCNLRKKDRLLEEMSVFQRRGVD